jgi:hypothetical protein
MAIQFPCPSCKQPIEVDDEYAGQSAACPYCRRVVNVPTESLGEVRPAAMARPTLSASEGEARGEPREVPTGGEVRPWAPPPPPPDALHVGPLPRRRDRVASTYGTYALICTVLVALLYGASAFYGVALMMSELGTNPTSQPSPEEMGRAQAAAMQKMLSTPWVKATNLGAAFFAVVGVALGIVSLRAGRRANWKAIVSLVVCGMLAICTCGTLVSSLSGMTMPAPANLLL